MAIFRDQTSCQENADMIVPSKFRPRCEPVERVNLMPRVRIRTDKPVALDSPDHIHPWGTAHDNSVNATFNRKLRWWIGRSQLRLLDLGCAGGGLVRSVLEQGGFAIGIEGSDYSKVHRRSEWARIPNNLFTADITARFELLEETGDGNEDLAKFNVITAWEVMEHIQRDRLSAVAENILRHLSPSGVVIMSITPNEDIVQGVRLHQTVESREWWTKKFTELGFAHHERATDYFGSDWVRGGKNAPNSFHLVMTRKDESLVIAKRLFSLNVLLGPYDGVRRMLKELGRLLDPFTPQLLKQVYGRLRD